MRDFRIIIRRYLDGWTCKRIADELGCTPATVTRVCHDRELVPYIQELKRRKTKQDQFEHIVKAMSTPKPQKKKPTRRPQTMRSLIARITRTSTRGPYQVIAAQETDDKRTVTLEQKTDESIVRHTIIAPKMEKQDGDREH